MNIAYEYEKITGVSLKNQEQLWDERGKGYFGEFLVFSNLFEKIHGYCKILMNLQIPSYGKRTTEIDLVLIHETGIYVFEVKHYKGVIYGKESDEKWTQYFRTASNSYFLNPIKQNEYHVKCLSSLLQDIPMYSCVVFTNPECELRISQGKDRKASVFTLSHIDAFADHIAMGEERLNVEAIDNLFNVLKAYAPDVKDVVADGETIPFYEYINVLGETFQKKSFALEREHKKTVEQCRRRNMTTALISAIIVVFFWLCSMHFSKLSEKKAEIAINDAQQALDSFAQKFEKAGEYGDLYINGDFLTITDAHFASSKDFANTVKLGFTVNWNGENYGVSLTKDTRILIQMRDGIVKEFYLPESMFKNGSSVVRLGKERRAYYFAHSKCEIPYVELYNVDLESVSYIKLSGIGLWEYTGGMPKELSTSIDWKVYDSATDKLVDRVD